MQDIQKKRWLTPKEFEQEFNMKISTQYKMRKERKVPYSKIGSFIRYDRLKIDKWFDDHSIVE